MIEEKAEVISIKANYTMVRSMTDSACQHCQSSQSCSHEQLLFSTNNIPNTMKVQNPVYAKPGDIVIVGIQNGQLVKSAFIVYLLPLLLLLGFSLTGHYSFSLLSLNQEIGSITFGLIGLMIGIFITQNHKMNTKQIPVMPVILRQAIPITSPIHFNKQTGYI